MDRMRIFFGCPSGYVQPRARLGIDYLQATGGWTSQSQVVSLGWLISALLAVLLVFGAVTPASASYHYCCYLIGPGEDIWCCNPDDDCVLGGSVWNWRDHVEKDSNGTCFWLEATCSCF